MRDIMSFYDMMQYRRPAGSKSERRFIKRFLDSIDGMLSDAYGNRYIVVGDDAEPTTMFSAHTDTMHSKYGRQKLELEEDFDLLYTNNKEDCLGADDGTGIFIMLNMIDAGVKGLYVFHREEECGGGGGIYFAKNMIANWPEIERCIAFDRMGYSDVITHQMGMRCCSDDFAEAFALALGANWKADDTGVFTDSESYTDDIPECTNISVGYFNQHTNAEYQDIGFMSDLIPKLIALEWDELPTVRDPSIREDYDWGSQHYDDGGGATRKAGIYQTGTGTNWAYDYDTMPTTLAEVEDMLYSEPQKAVELICDLLDLRS